MGQFLKTTELIDKHVKLEMNVVIALYPELCTCMYVAECDALKTRLGSQSKNASNFVKRI